MGDLVRHHLFKREKLKISLELERSDIIKMVMNKLIIIFKRLLKNSQDNVYQEEFPKESVHTAAFTSTDLAEELHKGKRRLKENYTSHWDLDYLPREEVEEILAKQLKPSNDKTD